MATDAPNPASKPPDPPPPPPPPAESRNQDRADRNGLRPTPELQKGMDDVSSRKENGQASGELANPGSRPTDKGLEPTKEFQQGLDEFRARKQERQNAESSTSQPEDQRPTQPQQSEQRPDQHPRTDQSQHPEQDGQRQQRPEPGVDPDPAGDRRREAGIDQGPDPLAGGGAESGVDGRVGSGVEQGPDRAIDRGPGVGLGQGPDPGAEQRPGTDVEQRPEVGSDQRPDAGDRLSEKPDPSTSSADMNVPTRTNEVSSVPDASDVAEVLETSNASGTPDEPTRADAGTDADGLENADDNGPRDAVTMAVDEHAEEHLRGLAREHLDDLESDGAALGGDPRSAIEAWHEQGQNDRGYLGTCGLVAGESLLRQRGHDVTENGLVEQAVNRPPGTELCTVNGPADERGGTNDWQRQDLLAENGEPTSMIWDASLDELADRVDAQEGVIALVNAGELWDSDDSRHLGSVDELGRLPTNHAVHVTGTVRQSGELTGFIINDSSGRPGQEISIDHMARAWSDTGGRAHVTFSGLDRSIGDWY